MTGMFRLVSKPPPRPRFKGVVLRFSPMLRYLAKTVWTDEDVNQVRKLLSAAEEVGASRRVSTTWDVIDEELSRSLDPAYAPG